MRALILVVLAGTALYCIWLGFGSAKASSPNAGNAPVQEAPKVSGRLLSVTEMEAALGDEALPDASEGDADRAATPREAESAAPEGSAAVPPPGGQTPETQEPSALDWELGDPVAEGSLVLHEVDRLPEYLKGRGSKLSQSRKSLLFGFGLLIRGLTEHAGDYKEAICTAPDVTTEERSLFLSLLDGGESSLPVPGTRSSPLLLGVRMALTDVRAKEHLTEQRFREAAACYSSLLLAEADAPWSANRDALRRWSGELAGAQARYRWDRNGEWPSIEVEAKGATA